MNSTNLNVLKEDRQFKHFVTQQLQQAFLKGFNTHQENP